MPVPTITLVSVTSRNAPAHVAAINRTMDALRRPCERLIVCPQRPVMPAGFQWATSPEFAAWKYPDSYNAILLRQLAGLVVTDFIITVHDDGFGRHADRWTDDFLRYDYIGAPWPSEWACGGHHVGNGGFSLRSRQLLWLCQANPVAPTAEAEDVYICRTHRDWFTQRKCRFAPVDLALRFSTEYGLSEYPQWTGRQSFGFHGRHHLSSVGLVPPGARLQRSDFTPARRQ